MSPSVPCRYSQPDRLNHINGTGALDGSGYLGAAGRTRTRPFDPAAYLDSPEAILFYLDGAFVDGDAGEIADALGVVARTRGMSQLAEKTGLTRQALYKALSSDGNPEFATVLKVIRSLGFRLHPEPAPAN